jgi:hypothetical protein
MDKYVVIWKDGTWAISDRGGLWEYSGDPDFMFSIPLSVIKEAESALEADPSCHKWPKDKENTACPMSTQKHE